MTEKEYWNFKKFEKMMKQIPGTDRDRAAVPQHCKDCTYYQPNWKYRTCSLTECPYRKRESVFRKVPLLFNSFAPQEVVMMRGV